MFETMKRTTWKRGLVTALAALASLAVDARPMVGHQRPATAQKGGAALKATAADCNPAQASVDLDINNVRARINSGGDMWWDLIDEARYEIPKGSRKHSLYSGSMWIGGYDPTGILKVAAQTYRQGGNDYYPGPISGKLGEVQSTDKATCSEWDRMWKVNASDISTFREMQDAGTEEQATGPQYDAIWQWPAAGNNKAIGANGGSLIGILGDGRSMAPFVDADSNGIYDPTAGDYPDILGAQFIWWVFNDAGNSKQETATPAIGFEVQTAAFAFSTNDFLNDATFYRYSMINRGPQQLDSCFMATWTDADLGYAFDDYIGCDTARGLGVLYNASAVDGNGEPNSYGSQVPMVGVDFFIGPLKKYKSPITGNDTSARLKMSIFNYFSNTTDNNGNPNGGVEIYNYITGTNRVGQPLHNDYQGPGIPTTGRGPGPSITYVFDGDPSDPSAWSECNCKNPAGDRRFIHTAGAFTLEAGGTLNEVTIGCIWVPNVGGCPNTSFTKIYAADDQAQDLFDSNFQLLEGPEAPRLIVREMDRRLVFYMVNDRNSNNYRERFGLDTNYQGYKRTTSKASEFGGADSLYKFEGYRVFQLRNASVSAAQIFDETGAVDNFYAREIFQCDVRNGVKDIINYQNNKDLGDSLWTPVLKVKGKDSGIVHSFEWNTDQFATDLNQTYVNYKSYYFLAVAYAYNDFAPFSVTNASSTQDIPYLGSSAAANGRPLQVVSAMPNPLGAGIGSVLNADYGDGMIIKRLEGKGNGGQDLQLSAEAEAEALTAPGYATKYPVYVVNKGPIDVKVVDPVKVKGLDWELYIQGTTWYDSTRVNADTSRGIIGGTGRWTLISSNRDTLYSDTTIGFLNEQILEDYGISVNIVQQVRPGNNEDPFDNGLIMSQAIFSDPTYPWLTGVFDGEERSSFNWIRSGNFADKNVAPPAQCDPDDYVGLDSLQKFENLLDNLPQLTRTWAPYGLAAYVDTASECNYGVAYSKPIINSALRNIYSVDVVLTSDRSKWSRAAVVEMGDRGVLSEGNARKHRIRRHAGWNGDVDGSGNPIYSTAATDSGMSMFPGYAINQETGERLNIFFAEESYLRAENGSDMLWNPTSTYQSAFGDPVYGGKHYVYVHSTKYNGCDSIAKVLRSGNNAQMNALYRATQWVGTPMLRQGFSLKSLRDGTIPGDVRLRFRVKRPYNRYVPDSTAALRNSGLPLYSFTTRGAAPVLYSDVANPNKDSLMDNIGVVPNPYYAYTGYEANRLDTRVRIINLPRRATVTIYGLDGAVVRKLEKENAEVSYLDWDIRNAKGLPIASGMYLIHVSAPGYGEKVLKWFGAMRPVDIVNY